MSRFVPILLALGLVGCASKTYLSDEGFTEYDKGVQEAAADDGEIQGDESHRA